MKVIVEGILVLGLLTSFSFGFVKDDLFYPHNLQMVLPTVANQDTDWVRYLTERAPYMGELTVCVWEKNLNPSNGRYFVSYAVAGDSNHLSISTDIDEVRVYLDGDDYFLLSDHNVDERNHFCVWFSQKLGSIGLYVNGLIKDSKQYTGGQRAIKGGGVWVFGQEQDSLGGGFDIGQSFSGDLINFVVYRRVLTRDEIYRIAFMCNYPYDTYISPHFAQLETHGHASINYTAPCPTVPNP